MRAKLGTELKRSYNEHRHIEFARCTHRLWDSRRNRMYKLQSSAPKIPHTWELADFCNKATMFYWAHSAQEEDRCPILIFACIYKEWFRHDHANIEFGHFFANPIRVTSTGPTTVSGVLEAHRSLCEQATLLLGKIESGKAGKSYLSIGPGTQNFKLLPLCRAILVIIDRLPPHHELDPPARLDDIMQRLSVILVLTGDDSGLITPITFDGLRAQSLPLARTDCTAGGDGVNAIRVPLGLAVRFIADLERKQDAAFRGRRSGTVDESICPFAVCNGPNICSADEWVNEIVKRAVAEGEENVLETRYALQRIQAAQRGEEPDWNELQHLNARWI